MSVFRDRQLTEEQTVKSEEFESPRCLDFFSKWRFCLSSHNQFHQYYIYGKFKDCSPYRKAITSCMMYKSTKSQQSKEFMVEVLKMDEIKFTSSSVWEKRENPSEYWDKKK